MSSYIYLRKILAIIASETQCCSYEIFPQSNNLDCNTDKHQFLILIHILTQFCIHVIEYNKLLSFIFVMILNKINSPIFQ